MRPSMSWMPVRISHLTFVPRSHFSFVAEHPVFRKPHAPNAAIRISSISPTNTHLAPFTQNSSVITDERVVSPDAGGTSLASTNKLKKAAEHLTRREAENQVAEKALREMARAVMQKRSQMLSDDAEGWRKSFMWEFHHHAAVDEQRPKNRAKSKDGPFAGHIRQNQGRDTDAAALTTVNTATERFDGSLQTKAWRGDGRASLQLPR